MNISRDTKVFVNGEQYRVLAKVLYVSSPTGRKYWKAFLSGDSVIVYDADNGEMMGFGILVNDLELDFSNIPNTLEYKGKVYKLDGGMEYERVLNFEFGDLSDAEGECKFANYSSDDGSWLSPGLISETGARADFYGENPDEYEIKLG